jgi:hypothetical protein
MVMPNGVAKASPPSTPDAVINAEWTHQLHHAQLRVIGIGWGIAALMIVGLSYLLQSGYRAVLYVIFG